MSTPLCPFERPGQWRAKVTIYRDDVAIATADSLLTEPDDPLDLQEAAWVIACRVGEGGDLTARGRREEDAAERGGR